eukprot:8373951-Prorocentrum_lima.AAC.1
MIWLRTSSGIAPSSSTKKALWAAKLSIPGLRTVCWCGSKSSSSSPSTDPDSARHAPLGEDGVEPVVVPVSPPMWVVWV